MTKDGLLRLEGWARQGLTDEQIAKNAGIRGGTLYEWMKKYPEIKESIKRGKAPVDFEVENALLKRALGYEYEEVMQEIEELPDGSTRKHTRKVKRHVSPDSTAMIFWLKNRKPATWRDKPEPPVSNEVMDRLDEVLDSIKGVV